MVKLSPPTSRNPATAVLSSSTRKLYPWNGSLRSPVAMIVSPRASELVHRRAASPLADANDHELRRLYRCDADEQDQSTVVDVVLGHRRTVAPHEVRVLTLRPHQGAVAPDAREEARDRLNDARP